LEGIVNIDKPIGLSSFDVIRRLRKIIKMKRIGHTGTLDPLATGVLVICLGEATKLASEIEAESKVYLAEMEFGYATDTYDTEGKVVKTACESFDYSQIDSKFMNRIFAEFLGIQQQIPPMYSALKVDGKKLYELARENIEIERKPRGIFIEYIKLVSIENKKIKFEVKVSKGTYIRTLIEDIGVKIGCFATMTALRRLSVGSYKIEESFTLEDIEKCVLKEDSSFVKGIEASFSNVLKIDIDSEREYKLFKNGNTVVMPDFIDGIYRIYSKGKFEGLGKIEEERLKGYKVF
jgi:tRNA pseudouridine55 synthase